MTNKHPIHTVAVINSNEDIIEFLRLLLEDEGFHAVGEHLVSFKKGRVDFAAFCQQHQPEVFVLDIAPRMKKIGPFSTSYGTRKRRRADRSS